MGFCLCYVLFYGIIIFPRVEKGIEEILRDSQEREFLGRGMAVSYSQEDIDKKIRFQAFDQNIIGINPDYIVEIRPDIMKESDGPMLKHGLQEMDKAKIFLPKPAERPSQEFLEIRYTQFKDAI